MVPDVFAGSTMDASPRRPAEANAGAAELRCERAAAPQRPGRVDKLAGANYIVAANDSSLQGTLNPKRLRLHLLRDRLDKSSGLVSKSM